MISAACELSNTGQVVWPVIVVGIVLLLAGVGAFVVLGARRRRSGGGGALLLVLVLIVLGAGVSSVAGGAAGAAQAATTAENCPPGDGGASGGGSDGPDNSLTIVQTSVNDGMAPNVAPTALTGTITNHGTASALITEVTVSIGSVTKAGGAPTGTCDATDYVLVSPIMPVGVTLAPDQTASFDGAMIGFSDKSVNQDACKGATLTLLYTSS